MPKIKVENVEISVIKVGGEDYISLTDMVREVENGSALIEKWLRNKNTIEFLGIWEEMYNPDFNSSEFGGIMAEAGTNRFLLSAKQWIERTNARGIVAKAGRYGGTYAQKDLAFEFASWVSPKFKLYLIRDYQRLKADEQRQLGWSAKRELAKINYRIHTDAIQNNLIPPAVSRAQMNIIYANEADVLNVALFGKTHQQWQRENPTLKGNQRYYATINQLICISNMENINAEMINENAPQKRAAFRRVAAQRAWRASARAQRSGRKEPRIPQPQRLKRLNEIAIHQMRVLSQVDNRNLLK